MQELFDSWAQLQALPEKAHFAVADMLEHVSREIDLLEKLLDLRCYKIPGATKEVRELLQDRLQEWRDTQGIE